MIMHEAVALCYDRLSLLQDIQRATEMPADGFMSQPVVRSEASVARVSPCKEILVATHHMLK